MKRFFLLFCQDIPIIWLGVRPSMTSFLLRLNDFKGRHLLQKDGGLLKKDGDLLE